MSDPRQHAWLDSPLGAAVLDLETRVMADALGDVFGFELLQLGCWGSHGELCAHARTQHRSCLAPDAVGPGAVRCDYEALPIASNSVEAVLLPHTLEHAPHPHALLREVERVLVGEGHVLVCGFNPYGPWGVRHLVSRGRFPPSGTRMLSEGRLRDWLGLLGFEVTDAKRYLFAPPWSQRISERIEDLAYGSVAVRSALLLFNIAGLLEQRASTQRFQFDGYKTNYWDIEHVRSVAEYIPGAAADRKRWLEHAGEFVASPVAEARDLEESKNLRQQIDVLLAASSPEEQAFMDVFGRVRALSGEGEARVDDNALSNLALLDMGTNRSYKNAIFPVKRTRIIELDKLGQFVPPATRNVFLKYYSPNAAQLMLWDGADQDAYGNAIEETLRRFFAPLVRKAGGV